MKTHRRGATGTIHDPTTGDEGARTLDLRIANRPFATAEKPKIPNTHACLAHFELFCKVLQSDAFIRTETRYLIAKTVITVLSGSDCHARIEMDRQQSTEVHISNHVLSFESHNMESPMGNSRDANVRVEAHQRGLRLVNGTA